MKTAVALGTFDGVHAGHKAVLEAAVNSGHYSVAVAFRIPPKAYFLKEGVVLTREDSKTALIKNIGIDSVDYLDFPDVKDICAADFFDYIYERYSPSLIVCGYNYSFGKGGVGNIALLKELCDEKGIELKVIDKIAIDGQVISSSFIRQLLKDGEISKAVSYLPDGFSVTGKVIHGDKRGRTICFPTVNQLYPDDLAPVKFGVYMTKTVIDGKVYYGMTNIGLRPTFPSNIPLCETNLFDFKGDLYGKTVTLYLLSFIREEKKFSSLEELKSSIEADRKKIFDKIKNQ